MTEPFETKERQEQFWADIMAVLSNYPEITSRLQKNYEEDPDEMFDPDEPFVPESPVFIDGVVLVTSICNMDGWRGLFWNTPPSQNPFQSLGMVQRAVDLM